jgi:hypothetical protein
LFGIEDGGGDLVMDVALFTAGLSELVQGLISWNDLYELWRSVALKGRVMGTHIARDAGSVRVDLGSGTMRMGRMG